MSYLARTFQSHGHNVSRDGDMGLRDINANGIRKCQAREQKQNEKGAARRQARQAEQEKRPPGIALPVQEEPLSGQYAAEHDAKSVNRVSDFWLNRQQQSDGVPSLIAK